MKEPNKFAPVPRPPDALERAKPGAPRILSGMVSDVLAVAQIDLNTLVRHGKALYLRAGGGMTEENICAFGLFFRAARGGHREGQYLLSECYLSGNGVEADLVQYLLWLHNSAESGFATNGL